MIDYLEEALTEEKEAENLPQGRRTAVRPPKQKRPEKPEADKEGSVRAEGPAQEETRVPSDQGTEEPMENVLSLEEVPSELQKALRRDGRLPLAEERAEAAGVLLQALSRTGRSLRALRSGPGVLTVSLPGESGGTAAGTDLESLDLAMQRDARRYDGGFPLY